MNRLTTILALCLPLALPACAPSNYFLAGGDRAGGQVMLKCTQVVAHSLPCPEEPTEEQKQEAIEACKRWGYTDARPFGSVTKIPLPEGTGWTHEMPFQCIGHLEN